jgi:hypothetical protein
MYLIRRTSIELESSFRVPEGMAVRTLPAPLEIDHPFLGYSSGCEKKGDSVVCTRKLRFKARTLPRADYPAFRKLCGRIDQAEAQEVVLAPVARP